MQRELFKYLVEVMGAGTTRTVEFLTYWSPTKEGMLEEVALAAAAHETTLSPRNAQGNFTIRYEGLVARLA